MAHNKKVNYFSQAGLIVFFLFAVLFVSCSAPEKRLERERITLIYRSQSTLDSEIKKLRLKHPIRVSKDQVMNHLLSLHYEELTLLGKKKYIFSPNDVIEITPLITKALNRMKPNNILYYEVDTPRGTTASTIFQAKGKIHWRFDTINGVGFENSSFPGFRGSTWRLLPKYGQAYYESNSLFSNTQQQNWIISNLELSVKSKRNVRLRSPKILSRNASRTLDKKQTKKHPFNRGELKKRLEFLKELHDKKLINEEEYKKKRKSLLDQFL